VGEDPTPYQLPDARVQQAWRRLIEDYLIVEALEPGFARRLLAEGITSFAELGSASGPISQLVAPTGVRCVAADLTPPPGAFEPMVRADLRHLPLRSGSFDAASAVNCLYFLAEPTAGVREAHRVLQPGGLFLTGAPSRYHDQELRHVLPDWGQPSPFDAEDAADIVGAVFSDVELEWWEAPAYHLADREAVIDYLVAFKVPGAEDRADEVPVPTQVTKSGVTIWARR
jgi:SAM-dependent methyltransferase